MNLPNPTTSKYQPPTPPILKKSNRPTGKPFEPWDEKNNNDFNWRREPQSTKAMHPLLRRPMVNLLQVVLLIAPCGEIVD